MNALKFLIGGRGDECSALEESMEGDDLDTLPGCPMYEGTGAMVDTSLFDGLDVMSVVYEYCAPTTVAGTPPGVDPAFTTWTLPGSFFPCLFQNDF